MYGRYEQIVEMDCCIQCNTDCNEILMNQRITRGKRVNMSTLFAVLPDDECSVLINLLECGKKYSTSFQIH